MSNQIFFLIFLLMNSINFIYSSNQSSEEQSRLIRNFERNFYSSMPSSIKNGSNPNQEGLAGNRHLHYIVKFHDSEPEKQIKRINQIKFKVKSKNPVNLMDNLIDEINNMPKWNHLFNQENWVDKMIKPEDGTQVDVYQWIDQCSWFYDRWFDGTNQYSEFSYSERLKYTKGLINFEKHKKLNEALNLIHLNISHGADATLRNNKNETALDLAKRNAKKTQNFVIANYLQDAYDQQQQKNLHKQELFKVHNELKKRISRYEP